MTSHPSDLELWTGAAAQHLSTCERCAERLETVSAQQRATSEQLAATLGGPVALPPEVEQRVAEALAGERVVPLRPRWGRWVAGAGVAAAAVVVAGVVVPQMLQGGELRAVGESVSAPEVSSGDTAGGAPLAPQEADAPPPLPADVRAAAEQLVAEGSPQSPSSCGTTLAAELAGQVVTSGPAAPREGVLVVVRTGEGTLAWWLPSCEATATTALGTSSLP